MRIVVVLAVLGCAAYAVLVLSRYYLGRRTSAATVWRLQEEVDGDVIVLTAVRGSGLARRDPPIALGKVSVLDEDFDQRIEDARAEARIKLVALNSGRPRD